MSDSLNAFPETGNDRRIGAVLLSAADVDRIYNISRATLYRRTAAGELQAKKIGRRTFWLHDSIREYLAHQPAPTLGAPATSSNDTASYVRNGE
jgi:predicted DNA-binding transcriptional regulator AlpA